MHIPDRLQECRDRRDPSDLYMCAPIYFCYLGYYICLFFTMKSAKFSSTHWNEFHFSKMKRFDVPSFFVIQSSVMFWNEHRTHDRMHFKSSCSLLCVYRVQWGYYLCLKMQWCCDDSSTLPLDALTERCPSKTSSILSHVSRFKTKTRWILNYSAGLSTLRHFKSPSTSFNTSRSVAGQRQGQRFFQWSDFCRGQFVSFWLWFRFMIKLMSHVRQWEHRSGFIGDFYYYDVGLLFSSAYGFVFFSVCLHLHQKRH